MLYWIMLSFGLFADFSDNIYPIMHCVMHTLIQMFLSMHYSVHYQLHNIIQELRLSYILKYQFVAASPMMNKFYLLLALSILSQCICVEFLDISSYFGSGISRNTRSKPKPAPKSEIGTRLNKFSFIIHLNFFLLVSSSCH